MELNRYSTFRPILTLSLGLVLAVSALASDRNLTVLGSSDSEFRFSYNFQSHLDNLPPNATGSDLSSLTQVIQVAIPAGAEAHISSVYGRGERSDLPLAATGEASIGLMSLADVSKPMTARGRTTVGVRVSPMAAGVWYDEVEVAINFDRGRTVASLSAINDPFYDRLWSAALANYEVARHWPVIDDSRATRSGQALGSAAVEAEMTPGLWYKIIVKKSGLVLITGAQLEAAGISLSNLASDSIHIFNAGGLPNDVDNTVARPLFRQVALLVQDGADNLFGRNDRLYFFGEPPSRWVYTDGQTPRFLNNRFTAENVYWLRVSGSPDNSPVRMEQVNSAPTGGAVPVVDEYRNWVRLEQDNMISIESDGHVWDFYNWYWTDASTLSAQVATPGAFESDSAYIYTAAATGRSLDVTVNGASATRISCFASNCQHYTDALLGGAGETNQLNLQLSRVSAAISSFLDYIDISYRSHLLPISNRLDFNLEGSDGEVEVEIVDAFTATPTILDVSDPLRPVVLTGFVRAGSTLNFKTTTSVDSPNRFYCDVISGASAPARIESTNITNLRADLDQTDMIIVTSRSLSGYLDEYAAYRGARDVTSKIVTVEDIVDNFSYGLYDPTAIRDFLKFAYESYAEPSPAIALLVGDASYDFHDHLGTGLTNLVPSFIRDGDRTYSDDNFVYFGDFGILDMNRDRISDMMTARWPVRTASEINSIVDKIKAYEASASFGDWRSRITLVADDEHTREKHNETYHTTQTETLEKIYVPRLLTRNKIYLWDYPFVNRDKPDVNDAIVDAFNEGSLIINYVGHGNPDVWSHEHVFDRGADLPRLNNADRLPLVYAASCDIGFFDDPRREGMAEDLLAMPGAGAIAVISATRLVYASENAQFNRAVYTSLFGNSDLSICEALFAAKIARQYTNPLDSVPRRKDNDRAYVFMGDPCLHLALPEIRLEFTEQPDSLVAAGVSRLTGRVVDEYGSLYAASGVLDVSVYDSDREHRFNLPDDTNSIVYYTAGPTIFRGTATVADGNFSLQFVTPLDVGYRGSSARISAYGNLGSLDAIGLVDSIKVSETQQTITDSDGPKISFGIAGRTNLTDGATLSQNEYLIVSITDQSGINLAGGLGHGIVLILDDKTEGEISLTDLFDYDRDDYTTGSLVLPLTAVRPGPHRFKIKAWDNVNNVSTVEFSAEITADNRLAVHDLLNYPNPMHDLTTFYFELSKPADELQVGIYTLSGKIIWKSIRYQLGADSYPNNSVEIVWDGRDAEGDRVAAGVYVYRLTAQSASEGERVEEYGKVVVLN